MSDEQERKRAVRQFEEALLAPYNGKGSVPAHELVAQVKEVGRLYAENERLRALVKSAEHSGSANRCPWCNAWEDAPHDDCPAFYGPAAPWMAGKVR